MRGFYDALHAITKAVKNGEVEITRDGDNSFTVTGDTYRHKTFIRSELDASWDRDAKCWRTADARETVVGLYEDIMSAVGPKREAEAANLK